MAASAVRCLLQVDPGQMPAGRREKICVRKCPRVPDEKETELLLALPHAATSLWHNALAFDHTSQACKYNSAMPRWVRCRAWWKKCAGCLALRARTTDNQSLERKFRIARAKRWIVKPLLVLYVTLLPSYCSTRCSTVREQHLRCTKKAARTETARAGRPVTQLVKQNLR